jgi:hypothetical protein
MTHPDLIKPTDLGNLIVRGLSGEHLHCWLPGNDNRAAISHLVSSRHSWNGPGIPWGSVVRYGIGEWAGIGALHEGGGHRRSSALQFITWAEVLAVIDLGCADGHRDRYEAAYRAWSTASREAWEAYKPTDDGVSPWVDQTAIRETKQALIRYGAGRRVVQDALF